MKKLLKVFMLIVLFMSFSTINVFANDYTIDDYISVVNSLNEEYDSELMIFSENDFSSSEYANQLTYDEYIDNILSIDLETFEKECLEMVNVSIESVNVIIDDGIATYSTEESKTVYFYQNYNTMTLKYKYTGSGSSKKFDTSYTPKVSVGITSSGLKNKYFVMSSHTGSFQNSNKSYKVTAKGSIYSSYGVVSTNQTFAITFTL